MKLKAAKFKRENKETYVVIKGITYTIKYTFDGLGENDGLCITDKKEILIDPTLSLNETKLTLLHEIMHAYWHEMLWDNFEIPSPVEEILVDGFSRLFYDLIESK